MSRGSPTLPEKAWSGRFGTRTDRRVERFTESISFDRRLFEQDIRASIAHVRMLAQVGLVNEAECQQIVRGLSDIRAEIEAKALAQARSGFDRVLKSAHIPRSRRHLVARYPIDAIPDVARKTRSAIVVMGAVSRSGLKSIFIGNTAERVLDRVQCDLLVVKPLGFETRVPRTVRGMRIAVAAPLP